MNVKPIPFSGPMIHALMREKDPKTQTRRIIKPQPPEDWDAVKKIVNSFCFYNSEDPDFHGYIKKIPYQSGDICYVKETWRIAAWDENSGTVKVQYKTDGAMSDRLTITDDEDGKKFEKYWVQSSDDAYKAGFEPELATCQFEFYENIPTRWRSSRFMPKWVARNFILIKAVRAERLQDITEEDAKAEGVGNLFLEEIGYSGKPEYNEPMEDNTLARLQFKLLWDSINAKRGHSWKQNNFVWVYSFELTEKPKGWPV